MNNLPSKPTGVLQQFATTQTSIDVFSDSVIQSVKQGEANPITVLIQLRAIEKAAERIIKEIRDNCLTAAEKYPGTAFEFMGNKVEKAEVGVKYDFSKCGDPVWETRKTILDMAAERLKERETYLKAITVPKKEIDEDTGEMYEVQPPTKSGTATLKITIK